VSSLQAESIATTVSAAQEEGRGVLQRLDEALSRWGDYLNPILVKETRQALKSRQFVFTFALLLLLTWFATIGLVAYVGPGISYSAAGIFLLTWYCWLLAFPLAVIVPFGSFRSLAAEREENTYDLLRVSTLTPRQIVNGKLASAIVQIGVYCSAVAPCFAFSYLLRGIDVVTILIVLCYIVLASIGLTLLGLLGAASAVQKQGQVVLSVAFVTVLLGCFLGGMGLLTTLLIEEPQFVMQDEFWQVTLALFSLHLTTCLLAYLATVSLTAPRTVNKSTPLRWGMLLQQAVFFGWCTYIMLDVGFAYYEMMAAMFLVQTGYWYLMGTLLSSESPELSHRVQRQLPQSVLGRWLLGWLNPGPGTGYLFAVANSASGMGLLGIAAGAEALGWGDAVTRRGWMVAGDLWEIAPVVVAAWCYLVIFLGIGKLLVSVLRRFATMTPLASFLVHALLVTMAMGIPYAIQMSVRRWRDMGFNPLQWSNPFWSIGELFDDGRLSWDPEEVVHLSVLMGLALCVLLLNLPSVAREIVRTRIAAPERVQQEVEAEQAKPSVPQNPWDEGPVGEAVT
jgi:ABC-type transport system involved in multi-copper enzyme maturation permease subunit